MDDALIAPIDTIQVFQLESANLRGRLVRLGQALDLILGQHAYPEPIATLLGEALVTACALASSLKYDGVFTLQVKSDGQVRMLVADVTSDGGLRAYAQIGEDPAQPLLGKGYLAFTVNQQNRENSYQGIVELQPGGIASAVQHYFRQSEQLPTGIVSACRRDAEGRWQAGCLLLQQMPAEGGTLERGEAPVTDTGVEDTWQRAMMLMSTCTAGELTDPLLPPEDLLYRLFHEEGVRVFEPQVLRAQCRCSDQRVASMLQALPRDEVEALAVDGMVEVTCQFCNHSYRFDEERRRGLFEAQSIR